LHCLEYFKKYRVISDKKEIMNNGVDNKVELYLEKFAKISSAWFSERASFLDKFDKFFNKEFFIPNYIETLDWEKVKKLSEHLHSFNSLALAKTRAINQSNNKIENLKSTFLYLAQELNSQNKCDELAERLKNILSAQGKYKIKFWGISAISEIIGQRFPNDFTFFNHRDREAIKFLEIDLNETKKDKDWDKYIKYIQAIEPIIEKYKEIVVPKCNVNYSIGIQIDQFFSWIYESFVEQKYQKTSTFEIVSILHNHLSKIKIEKYFSLESIELDNLSNEVYLLGENGVGKTILLQSILLSTKYNFIQHLTNKKYTGVILENIAKNPDFKFVTTDNENNEFTSEKQDNLYLKNIFAYGVYRYSTIKEEDSYEFLTLFTNEYSLINPVKWLIELYNRELEEKTKDKNLIDPHISLEKAKELLIDLLEKKIEIIITYNNAQFKESGTELAFEYLSDGYKSVMTWVIDMIARLSQNQPNIDKIEDFRGVILIDELDLFLHPQWGYNIVGKLRKWFPKIQFIISTHSPILTLGASKDAVFYKLYKENGITKISDPIKGNQNMTANSLITSLLWRLDTFTTRGIKPEFISSDDYIYQQIHQVISKRIQNTAQLTDKDVIKLIEEELDKIKF